jgi:hypothetical protein
MIGALLYLQLLTFWNRLLSQLRRLKRPKYLAGFLVGVLYFYLYFIRPLWMGAGARRGPRTSASWSYEFAGAGEVFGAAFLLVVVAAAWIVPNGRAALSFSEAEATFLFSAPVRRSTLIHFKLLRSQAGILFTTLLMSFFSNRFGSSGHAWIHVAGWWLILSILNLHYLGASFARSRLLDIGFGNRLRRWIVVGVLFVISAAAWWWMQRHVPAVTAPDAADIKSWIRAVRRFLETQPMATFLTPFRWVVRPYLASDFGTFIQVAWPAAILLVLHFVWVVRSDVAFEEASLELAQRRAERLAAVRRKPGQIPAGKARPAPFVLRPTGLRAVAFLWKNLISAGSLFTGRAWLILALSFGLTALLITMNSQQEGLAVVISMILVVAFIWSILLGPQLLRQDFRHDIRSTELLKLYPLPGWQVVLGELLAPTAILSAIQWTLVMLLVILFSQVPGGPEVLWAERVSVGLAVMILCPGVNFISLLIPNAGVLLFPAWLQTGPGSPHGIEATGQRLIFLLGQIFVFVLALVPAFAAAVATYFFLNLWLPWILIVPLAGLAGAVLLSVEVCLGVVLLGRIFERLDASTEVRG